MRRRWPWKNMYDSAAIESIEEILDSPVLDDADKVGAIRGTLSARREATS